MLDQRMLYKDILMYCPIDINFNNPVLDELYEFVYYEDLDEYNWAKIEVEAREFNTIEEALHKFNTRFNKNELYDKMLFIKRKDTNEKIATALLWEIIVDDKIVPMLHYVAVKEKYQGKGLGRKVVEKALYELRNKYPDEIIILHTQTWSWHAILLYLKLGFKIKKEGSILHYENKYEEAITELEKYIDKKYMDIIKKG